MFFGTQCSYVIFTQNENQSLAIDHSSFIVYPSYANVCWFLDVVNSVKQAKGRWRR